MAMEPSDDRDPHSIHPGGALSGRARRVLKDGDCFAIFDAQGDMRQLGAHEQGLFYRGTRYLSRLRLELDERGMLLLSSSVDRENALLSVDLTNGDYESEDGPVRSGTIHVVRTAFLWKDVCYAKVVLTSFARRTIETSLRVHFGADYADVFEVRGHHRERRGIRRPIEVSPRDVVLGYDGLDDVTRRTRITFTPDPTRLDDKTAEFTVTLSPRQSREIYLTVHCETPAEHHVTMAFDDARAVAREACQVSIDGECRIETTNEQFNDWIHRSAADLRMMVTETEHGPYPYAGVPWFSTPFGRDGILSAMAALWAKPSMAAGVLRFLASTQATERDPMLDAEPGKIVHEMRSGEMAALREIPFGRYYGSIDSTPLFVMLARAYYDVTRDGELIDELWPNIERALEWIDGDGDPDGDGFLEYGRRSPDGLIQQGWKDSHDSVFHHDGTLVDGPVALCEVQGYAFAAKNGAAHLAQVRGRDGRAEELTRQAHELRAHFDEKFWCPELGVYALALDGAKRPCRVVSSNAGQCLFTGIALPDRAARVASVMLGPEMFTGWGIRTLARTEQRYNPMAYHNGSIWPHDNALIAEGLASYGFKEEAARVLQGMFDASLFVDLHRLPELFCGFERREGTGPTLYPVACSPQAWAASAPYALLRAILGLEVDAHHSRIRFAYPTLPPFLERVDLFNLRVRDAEVDIVIERRPDDVSVHVARRHGQVEVVVVR
jgi:glycogen debranching enzyme